MKKKILAACAFLSMISMLITPAFADVDLPFHDFTIKAFQGTSIYVINQESSGNYLGLKLNKNGDVEDKVDFWGTLADATHTVITGVGTATEGSGQVIWVKYNDGAISRVLYSMNMKSNHLNVTSYTVSGTITY